MVYPIQTLAMLKAFPVQLKCCIYNYLASQAAEIFPVNHLLTWVNFNPIMYKIQRLYSGSLGMDN